MKVHSKEWKLNEIEWTFSAEFWEFSSEMCDCSLQNLIQAKICDTRVNNWSNLSELQRYQTKNTHKGRAQPKQNLPYQITNDGVAHSNSELTFFGNLKPTKNLHKYHRRHMSLYWDHIFTELVLRNSIFEFENSAE